MPLRREQILWSKFVFSSGISLVATEVLVVLSDLMLRMSPVMIVLHVGMIAVLCLGLSGISVGLGARLPNLRETDPSKIAAGFGGTLNLLVSLVFIFAIVTALALPCHLYFAGQEHPESTSIALSHSGFRFWLSIAIIASLIVGILGTVSRCGSASRRSSGWSSDRARPVSPGPAPCQTQVTRVTCFPTEHSFSGYVRRGHATGEASQIGASPEGTADG